MDDYSYYNSENDGYRGCYGDSRIPVTPQPPQQPPKKRGGAAKVIALLLACALVGGGAGAGGVYLMGQSLARSQPAVSAPAAESGSAASAPAQPEELPAVQPVVNTNQGKAMTPAQLYAANLPSCVGITVNTTVNIFGQTTTSAASGSGFVFSQDGYIVTNYHVIEDAAEDSSVTIEVSFADGRKFNARFIGGEPDNDVALIKIDADGLQPVTLGDSDKLVVGEPVYTIGNPLGELTYSLTDGLVSAKDRLITTSNGQKESVTLNVLQTNCAINPGNSGGPLFDAYGNVVGIVSAKYTRSSSGVTAEGLGFALPINDVKNLFPDLISHGYVTGKPYLGVQLRSVSAEAQRYGVAAGAAVSFVAEGSCAQKAGLLVNDIIIALDGTAIDSPSALTAALSSNYKAGDTAQITVIRSQETLTLTVTFDEKNEQTEANSTPPQQQQQQQNPNNDYYYYGSWPFSGFEDFFRW